MKTTLLLARFWAALAVVALISAACVPLPDSPPRTTTASTASANGREVAAPGATNTPLQATPTLTSAASISTASALSAAVAATSAPNTATATALPTRTAAPTERPQQTLAGPVWQWVSSSFKDGSVLAPSDPARYTFQLLGDGNALIQADCNFGTGSYQASGQGFAFTAIGTTKTACPPEALDSAFIAQLRYIASYRFEGGDLVVALQDDAGSMRLRPAPAEGVAGAAATKATGTSSPTEAPLTSPASLPTGTPPPVTTTPAPPPAVSPTPRLIGTPVPLPTALAAATVLPALNGTNWILVSLTAKERAFPPVGPTPITLEIDPDGRRISGSTGCNLYRATLTADTSGAAVLGPALLTQKACAANLTVQEVEFVDALLRARSYVLRGNELTFVDVAGNSLMVLVRK